MDPRPAAWESPNGCRRRGAPSDFRILASTKAGTETVASVGDPLGFVLCAVRREANAEPPFLFPWPGGVTNGLWSFPGVLRLDAVRGLTRVGEDGRGSSALGLHHLVTGRFKPGVTRIEVVWNGGRRVDAALGDGYFLARVDSLLIEAEKPPNGSDAVEGDRDDPSVVKGDAERGILGQTHRMKDERVLSITAFGPTGEAVEFWKAPGRGLREFDPSRCPYASRKPDLCFD